jgi:hypothetical protein
MTMKENFNQRMLGISPEQTRQALLEGMSMVERERPQPTLKPSLGMGQAVDNQAHKQKLIAERERLSDFREQAIAIHTQLRMNGTPVSLNIDKQMQPIHAAHKLRDDFNTYTAQAHDRKEIGWGY